MRHDGERATRFSYVRLAFTLLFFAFGAWCAVTREARFDVGGDDNSNRRAIHVDAHGMDAVVVGAVFVALGLLNLALGIPGETRIPVFWSGAGLLAATVLYGVLSAIKSAFS
jgi:hypothetical protein